MIDDMTPLTLAEAASYFPTRNGRRLHVRSIQRRIIKGCRGVRLAGFKDGTLWFTTRAWIREFQDACTRKAGVTGRTAAEKERDNRRSRAILIEEYGFQYGRQDGKKGRKAGRAIARSNAGPVPDLQEAPADALRPVQRLLPENLPWN